MCFNAAAQKAPESAAVTQAETVNYSPYYAKVGTTIFVSGPLQYWAGKLFQIGSKSSNVERIVFVNATSARPEVTGSEIHPTAAMRSKSITTVVIGRCDLWCSRFFTGGKTRQFGQDLPGQNSFVDIQVPIDYVTKKLETRFPDGQWTIYERNEPKLIAYKDMFYEGLTKGGMTGGLHIYADQPPQFCLTRNPDSGCKTYETSAFIMGVTTQSERVTVMLPDRFPAPEPSSFANLSDVKALPTNNSEAKAEFQKFLSAPSPRAFALAENGAAGAYYRGSSENAANALKDCELKAQTRCRLYAVDGDVVW